MNVTHVEGGEWFERARALREDGWWLADLTAVDRLHLGNAFGSHRFEVVVQLLHHSRRDRQTVRIPAEGEPPEIASVAPIWPNARYHEREVFDLMGIVFEGHENLTRILLPDEWEGHPLRKDYGTGKVTVQFVPQPFLQIDAPGQSPSMTGARANVDELGQAIPEGSSEERNE